MFNVTVGAKNLGRFESFKKAFLVFWKGVNKQMNRGSAVKVLGVTNFLVRDYGKKSQRINFYEARDFAYDCGLLFKGEFQDFSREPSPRIVEIAFSGAYKEKKDPRTLDV